MTDWFLQRGRAKLGLAKLLGVLDRWIRRKLREASDGKLLWLSSLMRRRIKEIALGDSPTSCKTPSMGVRMRIWREYPLKKYLDSEEMKRYDERAEEDPSFYLTPFDRMTNAELDGYIRWRSGQPPDSFDRLSVEEKYSMWKRVGQRSLPVLPRSGSLPSNSNVRRSPNHREGSGRAGDSSKTGKAEAPQAKVGESQGPIFRSLEDREIH